ncbi:BatD family protein [Pseudomonas pseudonitroreducens]|uniref:BatD family protein n=1 Tax=Pseudomonas pseudonitroreducens TaxID=2892326 RepID=UPI001F1EA9FD|nr:BatD family protein [Pseudomonas pseudonitroreducens]
MRRALLLLLLCWPWLGFAAEPEVKVRSQLLPGDSVLVGGTLTLQVDLLVDTWFAQPPQLPALKIAGAVVSEPSSEATHLNEKIAGKPFFGLRYGYQITPQNAGEFTLPALDIQVQPGQGSGPLQITSQPLHFTARAPAGAASEGGQRLVASQVRITQELKASHQPLRVGDSVTRTLHITAEGAQAMLIPAPDFATLQGLRRYVQSPTVQALSDGRGGSSGGERMDAVTYVIDRAGDFQLPAIELHWWAAESGEQRSVTAPALEFAAQAAAAYQAPFSISDDLRELGRRAQLRIAGHWLLLAGAAALLAALGYALHRWGVPLRALLLAAAERRREVWRESPGHAWRQVRRQLKAQPPQLGALYLWLRRSTDCRQISSAVADRASQSGNPLLAFLRARYARADARSATASAELLQALPQLHREIGRGRQKSLPAHALKPLNP